MSYASGRVYEPVFTFPGHNAVFMRSDSEDVLLNGSLHRLLLNIRKCAESLTAEGTMGTYEDIRISESKGSRVGGQIDMGSEH